MSHRASLVRRVFRRLLGSPQQRRRRIDALRKRINELSSLIRADLDRGAFDHAKGFPDSQFYSAALRELVYIDSHLEDRNPRTSLSYAWHIIDQLDTPAPLFEDLMSINAEWHATEW